MKTEKKKLYCEGEKVVASVTSLRLIITIRKESTKNLAKLADLRLVYTNIVGKISFRKTKNSYSTKYLMVFNLTLLYFACFSTKQTLMGIFYYVHSVALIEDLPLKEHYEDPKAFYMDAENAYGSVCWHVIFSKTKTCSIWKIRSDKINWTNPIICQIYVCGSSWNSLDIKRPL